MGDYLKIAQEALSGRGAGLDGRSQGEPARPLSPVMDLLHADQILGRAGVRLMTLDDGANAVGVWSDTDTSELREAVLAFGWEEGLIRYLDGPGIPERYKTRRNSGGEGAGR